MGFITSLLLDAVVMSSVFAGVRRVTGISVQQLLEPRIRGEMAKLASRLFFLAVANGLLKKVRY